MYSNPVVPSSHGASGLVRYLFEPYLRATPLLELDLASGLGPPFRPALTLPRFFWLISILSLVAFLHCTAPATENLPPRRRRFSQDPAPSLSLCLESFSLVSVMIVGHMIALTKGVNKLLFVPWRYHLARIFYPRRLHALLLR